MLNCYTICDHCQSWPDGYTCSHPSTFVRNLSGQIIQIKECPYVHLEEWDEQWTVHPCPLFKGTIILNKNTKLKLKVAEERGSICYVDG